MVKYWSSKPTLGVRFPPTSMIFSFFNFNTKKLTNIFSIVFIFLILLMNDFFTGSNFSQKVLLGLGIAFSIYWTVSIFVFLFKQSLYKSFTVVIQRYWKRTLYLFWVLELFLFSIYTYLVLIAPTEVEWLLDQPQLFLSNWWDGTLFLNKLLPILLIILLNILISYLLLNGNMLFLTAVVNIITVLLSSVLFSDTAQTIAYSVYFTGLTWDFDLDSGVWALNTSVDKTRVITHYIFLITLLKFWHTVFIVAFWLITVMFFLQSPYVGQGAFSSNKQNFFFLYGFAFIWTIFLYKSFMQYSYQYVYQWFFVNPWGVTLSSISDLFEPIKCLI